MAKADMAHRWSKTSWRGAKTGGFWGYVNPKQPRHMPEPAGGRRQGGIVAWRAEAPEVVFENDQERKTTWQDQ